MKAKPRIGSPFSILRSPWLATVLTGIISVGITATAAAAAGERSGLSEIAVLRTARPGSAPSPVQGPAGVRDAETPATREQLPAAGAAEAPAKPGPQPNLLVQIPSDLAAHAGPSAGAPVIGEVPDASKYYGVPTVAWVERVSSNGRWGKVQIPYVSPRRTGWIKIEGLGRRTTWVSVRVDVSGRRITVFRRNAPLFSAPAAVGAPGSPTPPGRYFVTDRIPFYVGHYFGSFAFGISGIQPNLPAGWSGGNQLAIHGTNNPSSIGQAASAGCPRVAESTLAKLKPLLVLGTPVIVVP